MKGAFSRKIGVLSLVLLSFILVLCLYAVVRLHDLRMELRQEAEVDIPLMDVAAKLNILQMEQHILIEKMHIADMSLNEFNPLISQYKTNVIDSVKQLNRLRTVINESMIENKVVDFAIEHKRLLTMAENYEKNRIALGDKVISFFNDKTMTDTQWLAIEVQFTKLDEQTQSLIKMVDDLTQEVANLTERHANKFIWIQSILGIMAFLVGLLLTARIIIQFRHQLAHINRQLDVFSDAVIKQELPHFDADFSSKNDELSGIVTNINRLMEKMSTEIKTRFEVESQLIHLATTDELTGAYNRHKWEDAIQNSINLAERDVELSIIMLDLDHFKQINDQYGHEVGDRVLVEAVRLIKKRVRQADLVFRFGGEEFAILLVNTSNEQAALVAEDIRADYAAFDHEDLPQFTASFGVTQFEAGDTIESFQRRVDDALYQSKTSGRNTVTTL